MWSDLTAEQGGLVSRRQLLAVGFDRDDIDSLVRSGRLLRTQADGVYRAAGAPGTPVTESWFAVLSTNSPLSFMSGAAWWDVPVPGDGLIHITRFDRRRLVWPPGVRVHRVGVEPSAVTTHRGLAVTTRRETVLDCIGYLPFGAARTLADRALHQGWLTPADATARLVDQRGRWGNRQIRRVLAIVGDRAAAESERRLHRILREAGITGWVANMPFSAGGRSYEIDVAFPALRIAIEIDGYEYHSREGRFQTDRTRQNVLIAAGWRVLRFTWADLDQRPWLVVRQIRQLLAA
ncbi:MAG TPA: type IV toxin-antitoxin system AbiEi family antitoxin domain-containing protein [Jatrophihabitans sp.]|jgi:very-short-patch-repair endonuclease